MVQNCGEDSGKEMPTLPKHGRYTGSVEDRSRMESERLDQDTGKHEIKECCHQDPGHDEKRERPRGGGQRSKERGRESLCQTVLICQPTDTRLRDDDRDLLGTVTLTAKDFRRILTYWERSGENPALGEKW